MIIKVFDSSFNAVNTITNIISLQWYDKWQDVGTFELHTTDEVFEVGSIICFKHNDIVFGGYVSRIEKYDNEIVATGYDFKGLYNRRYMFEPFEAIAQRNVRDALGNSEHTGLLQRPMMIKSSGYDAYSSLQNKRSWTIMQDDFHEVWNPTIDATITGKFENATTIQASYYFEAIKKLMNDFGFGVTAYPDLITRKVNVSASMGSDLRNSVVLAYRNGNVDIMTHTLDLDGTYNSVIYPTDETHFDYYRPSTGGTGFYLREGYTSTSTDNLPLDDAKSYYKEHIEDDELSVTVNDRVVLQLGSTVSVLYRNQIYVKQISQLQYVFEFGNTRTIATIGKPNNNLLRRLKNVL